MTRAARLALAVAVAAAVVPTASAIARSRTQKPAAVEPAPPPPPAATPAAPTDVRPYDAQLTRLAEVLGALTVMRRICGAPDAEAWRDRMQALLDSEGTPPARRDRLAGAYNRGLQGYGLSYRRCTPNAHLVIERFLDEAGRLAREIGNRYRAT